MADCSVIGPKIIVSKKINPNQGSMIGSILTLSVTAEPIGLGFQGRIEGTDIGFEGLLSAPDIGFVGIITDSIGFNGDIGPLIQVSRAFNPNQGAMIGMILTQSITGDPVGIGFQGAIDATDIGFIGTIDDSDIGFISAFCDC